MAHRIERLIQSVPQEAVLNVERRDWMALTHQQSRGCWFYLTLIQTLMRWDLYTFHSHVDLGAIYLSLCYRYQTYLDTFPMVLQAIVAGAAVLSCVVALRWSCSSRRNARLPPGPPALPLLGNTLDMPAMRDDPATLERWASEYGVYSALTTCLISCLV